MVRHAPFLQPLARSSPAQTLARLLSKVATTIIRIMLQIAMVTLQPTIAQMALRLMVEILSQLRTSKQCAAARAQQILIPDSARGPVVGRLLSVQVTSSCHNPHCSQQQTASLSAAPLSQVLPH
jgi:hypothetical protein